MPHRYRGLLATPALSPPPRGRGPTEAEADNYYQMFLWLLRELLVHFRISRSHPRRWERLYRGLLRRYRPSEARRLPHGTSGRNSTEDESHWRPLVEDIVFGLPIPGFRTRNPERTGGRPRFSTSPRGEQRHEDAVVVWAIESVQRRSDISTRAAAEWVARNAHRGNRNNALRGRSPEAIRRHYLRARARLPDFLRQIINRRLDSQDPRNPPR